MVIQLCPTEQAVAEGAKSAEQEFEEVHGVKQPPPQEDGDDELD